MEVDYENPWLVENIDAFNFLCCPECVFRSKDESLFQNHALQNHPKSATLFHGYGNICIKEDPLEYPQYNIKIEPADETESELQINEHVELPNHYQVNDNNTFIKEEGLDPNYYQEEELDEHLNSNHIYENTEIERPAKRKRFDDQLWNPPPSNDRDKEYTCDFCNETFGKKRELKVHVIENHGTSCQNCDMGFVSESELRAHIRKVHKNQCVICDATFTEEQAMQDHVKEHQDQPCGYCGTNFEDPLKLRAHILESHDDERGRKCFKCDKVFARKSYYIMHKNTVHSDKKNIIYKCETCEYTTNKERCLINHSTKCPNTENGARKIAEKKLAKQIKKEQSKETVTCIKCDEKFDSSMLYIKHYKFFHGGEIPSEIQSTAKFFCDKCPKVYFSKEGLKKHQKNFHTKTKTTVYKCAECDEDFALKPYIEHYRNVHDSMPPDVKDINILFCDKCPLYYFSQKGLQKHALTHDVTKSGYQCEECAKTFRSPDNLEEHKKTVHLKITPYECDQCPKKFGTKNYLNKHKGQVHSKVTCDICHKEIYNPFELKRHKAAAHGIYPPGSFKCDQCPMFFSMEANLLNHKESRH